MLLLILLLRVYADHPPCALTSLGMIAIFLGTQVDSVIQAAPVHMLDMFI